MKVLVTGGGGFLGSAIVRRLMARGDEVRSFSRGDYPELRQLGVDVRQGDLTEIETIADAARGCELIIHTAAKAGIWGPFKEFKRVNVVGTQNVLMACHLSGIRKLVYTSSPSVVFSGVDMEGVDESAPYSEHYDAHYPFTKRVAEQLVVEANGPHLATVALRPHLIWGPGDPHLLPRLVARAKAGKLRRIGNRANLVDATYIDNAADAHILAADRIDIGSPIAGKAYFVAQGEPLPLWDLIGKLLEAVGAPPVRRRMWPMTAYLAGLFLESVYHWLPLKGEPPMTSFLARQLCTAHWFNLDAARRDLGYRPAVSLEDGLRRLREASLKNAENAETVEERREEGN
jgi:nucleoside-diphosphate-sugar epimerase